MSGAKQRFLCVHGHFYQPPRENPGLDDVELQPSAAPYHDWNERVTAECYEPLAYTPKEDAAGVLKSYDLLYGRLSFDFGPTLLRWLERERPRLYDMVLYGESDARARFGGHGSALAQSYHHVILPLAHERDRRTELRWGIRDSTLRYGRAPEGLWLPETAVDVPTLAALADQGIRFTVLAPRQAARVRMRGSEAWIDVRDGGIDPSRAYRCALPGGRSIALFFYDGPVSSAVAFGGALDSAEALVAQIEAGFSPRRPGAQLLTIATDGETYGHHRRGGERVLAAALAAVAERQLAQLTNFGQFLELHPPEDEVEIAPVSAWSCAHGVERWRSHCGCRLDPNGAGDQRWRAPLREALDELRAAVAERFERAAEPLLRDPWAARDDYVELLADSSDLARERYLARHAARALEPDEQVRCLQLLEMQRHALAMFTSCGWFFDDLAGIEAQQVLAHADRVLQLAAESGAVRSEDELERPFLARLAEATCNATGAGDGRRLFLAKVRPRRVDLARIAANQAIAALLPAAPATAAPHGDSRPARGGYDVQRRSPRRVVAGEATLAAGIVRVTSRATRESGEFVHAAACFPGLEIKCGVRSLGEMAWDRVLEDVARPFARGDRAEADAAFARAFPGAVPAFDAMLPDLRRRAADAVLADLRREAVRQYRELHRKVRGIATFLADSGASLPAELLPAAAFALDSELSEVLAGEPIDRARLAAIAGEAVREGVPFDAAGHARALAERLERACDDVGSGRDGAVARALDLAAAARLLPVAVDFARARMRLFESLLRLDAAGRARVGALADELRVSWR